MCCADNRKSSTRACTASKGALGRRVFLRTVQARLEGTICRTINIFLWQVERFSSGQKISWQKGEMIGAGAFGSVYTALNQDTGQLMAVKQVWPTCSSGCLGKIPC